jgi:hypothetical protein
MKSLPTILVGSAATVLMLNGIAFAQQQSQQQQYQQGQAQQHQPGQAQQHQPGQAQQHQPGQAQQYQQGEGQQLSSREVRQFMGTIERDINQMVQSRNPSRWRQWSQNNIADHAVFSRTNAIETEGQSRFIGSVTITKPDLLRLQGAGLSSMSEKLGSVEDFHLDLRVINIQPVGDSAAMVKSRISERATLMPTQGETGGRAGQQGEYTTGQGRGGQNGEESEDEPSRGRSPSHGQQTGLQLESHAICTHLIERNPDSGHLQIGMGICDAQTNAEF